MCTIIFAYGVFDGFAVASNRDEEYGRSFTPPSVTEHEDGWYVAPTDDREGGTWLGYNDAGVVVTLSNLPVSAQSDKPRSRGLLVADLLHEGSVRDALDELRRCYERDEYAGFNLVVGSPEGCFVGIHDGELRVAEPDAGVSVVTNTPFDGSGEKAREVSEVTPSPDGYDTAAEWLGDAKNILSSHDPEVCVHEESRGTTSSSVVSVPRNLSEPIFRFADGHPCENTYTNYARLP